MAIYHETQQRIQTQAFLDQRRDAVKMYAHNGDTSGMLAVAAAAQEQLYFAAAGGNL